MTTIGYVLILIGLLSVRAATKGLGITDIPGNLGDILTAALSGDKAKLNAAVKMKGTVDLSPDLSVQSGFVDGGSGKGGSGSSSGSWGDGKTKTYDLGKVVPAMVPIANELGNRFGIERIGGYRTTMMGGQTTNDHATGKSIDLFVKDKAQGDALVNYVIANQGKYNINYMIFWHRIWSPGGGWRAMPDRGSANNNHENHVHITIH